MLPERERMAVVEFPHRQSAHCESGATAALLRFAGIDWSEAMVFGLGQGLFFGYFPFIRINRMPLVTYRAVAGHVLRRIAALPGISMEERRFSDQEQAMQQLDRFLERSIPVGLQTGVYWLPYFPPALRFHFNGHNLVVYGKEGEDYLISDPVFPGPVRCPADDLCRARFASGPLAPKGKMYVFRNVPNTLPLEDRLPVAIRAVSRTMLRSPLPLVGVRGIRFLGRRIRHWPSRLGSEQAALHIGHVVRMQEEIGTGGAGFRYMYARFLQESGDILDDDRLRKCGRELVRAGDSWRRFAAMAARLCKGRSRPGEDYPALSRLLLLCSDQEEQVFSRLYRWGQG